MRNISQTTRDREFVSTEGHYKVPYRLPKKDEIFDFRWTWKVKVRLDPQFCLQNFRLVEVSAVAEASYVFVSRIVIFWDVPDFRLLNNYWSYNDEIYIFM